MENNSLWESLWALWVEWEWCMGAWDTCWQVIKYAVSSDFRCSSSRIQITKTQPLATEKLQIIRSLDKTLKHTSSQIMVKAIATHMLQHVPVGEDLQASIQIFLNEFNGSTAFHRKSIAGKCLLFLKEAQFAGKKSKIRSREERAVMIQFLESIPDDTRLLGCLSSHAQSEKWNRHVRNVLEMVLRRNVSDWTMFQWMELIVTEVALGASTDRIRAYFDRAFHMFPYSEHIWKTALAYEIRTLRSNRIKRFDYNRVKSIVYQGIRFCPYSRDLLFMAMEPVFSHVFNQEEWLTLIMTAEEHQLRLFTDPPLPNVDEETVGFDEKEGTAPSV